MFPVFKASVRSCCIKGSQCLLTQLDATAGQAHFSLLCLNFEVAIFGPSHHHPTIYRLTGSSPREPNSFGAGHQHFFHVTVMGHFCRMAGRCRGG